MVSCIVRFFLGSDEIVQLTAVFCCFMMKVSLIEIKHIPETIALLSVVFPSLGYNRPST